MARTKEYRKEEALEAAMTLFWKQGYSATSIQQLLTVMGLSRSSMYAEFGNKRDLFEEALARYNNAVESLIRTISDASDPAEAVRNFFDASFGEHNSDMLFRGCLLVNTILEMRDVDDELSTSATKYLEKIEQAFSCCFKRCARKGTLHRDLDPELLAGFFMTVAKGIRVVSRQQPTKSYLRGVVETALLVLGKNEAD